MAIVAHGYGHPATPIVAHGYGLAVTDTSIGRFTPTPPRAAHTVIDARVAATTTPPRREAIDSQVALLDDAALAIRPTGPDPARVSHHVGAVRHQPAGVTRTAAAADPPIIPVTTVGPEGTR